MTFFLTSERGLQFYKSEGSRIWRDYSVTKEKRIFFFCSWLWRQLRAVGKWENRVGISAFAGDRKAYTGQASLLVTLGSCLRLCREYLCDNSTREECSTLCTGLMHLLLLFRNSRWWKEQRAWWMTETCKGKATKGSPQYFQFLPSYFYFTCSCTSQSLKLSGNSWQA